MYILPFKDNDYVICASSNNANKLKLSYVSDDDNKAYYSQHGMRLVLYWR